MCLYCETCLSVKSVNGFVCLHAVFITVSLLLSVKSCVYCLCSCVDSNGLCQRKNFSTFLTLMVWLLTAQGVPPLYYNKTGEMQIITWKNRFIDRGAHYFFWPGSQGSTWR